MAGGGRGQRRILHTSDLHLGSLGDGACRSLEALVNLAIEAKVDLVLVAGDLFDHNRVEDKVVRFVIQQLRLLAAPTVILPGNHDCLVPDSVYRREELWKAAGNVYILETLDGESLALPDLGVVVWGRPIGSYGGDLRPLAGIPGCRKNEQWHIAMGHGSYVGAEAHPYRSFQISQGEIVASGQDYIALGHVASFTCVCQEPVKAYYCGSPSLLGTVAIADLSEETGVQVACCLL